MFNLQAFSSVNINGLVHKELSVLGVRIHDSQNIDIDVNSTQQTAHSIDEAVQLIQETDKETKSKLWEDWQDLAHVADIIRENNGGNHANLNNIVFLNCLKQSTYYAGKFSQLKAVHAKLLELFNVDVIDIHSELIHKFNVIFFQIISRHCKMLASKFKIQLLKKMTHKFADVDGPWANEDLTMDERVQDWHKYYQEDFSDPSSNNFGYSSEQNKKSPRYKPEYDPIMGVFFKYQDLNTDPYLFDDRDEESPYPITESASIV